VLQDGLDAARERLCGGVAERGAQLKNGELGWGERRMSAAVVEHPSNVPFDNFGHVLVTPE